MKKNKLLAMICVIVLVAGIVVTGCAGEEAPPPPDEYEPPAKSYPETTCINCGAPVPPGVSFCPACGAKVAED